MLLLSRFSYLYPDRSPSSCLIECLSGRIGHPEELVCVIDADGVLLDSADDRPLSPEQNPDQVPLIKLDFESQRSAL